MEGSEGKSGWEWAKSILHTWGRLRGGRGVRLRRPFLTVLLFCALQGLAFGQARTVAVTVDDLPRGGPPLPLKDEERINRSMIRAFSENAVPAVGFVNESKLLTAGELDARVQILGAWVEAGLELGNHTHTHPSLNRVDVETYTDDIIRGSVFTRWLQRSSAHPLRYFRHPFLHTGNTAEKKKAVEQFLERRGYRVAPVTIENSDWIFNVVYHHAGASERMSVALAYLEFNRAVLDFAEEATHRLFGRAIRHVLLLHVNELNADLLPKILQMYGARGYQWSTLEDTLQDPVYSRTDSFVGTSGVAWLFRWDYSDGVDLDWRQEPTPPLEILREYDKIQGTDLSRQVQ